MTRPAGCGTLAGDPEEGARTHEGRRRPRLRPPAGDRGRPDARAGPRPGARAHRDLAGCATPTSTPRAASGRSSRRRRSSRATRASGSSSASAPATRHGLEAACASRCRGSATPAATAVLQQRARDALPESQQNMGYAINGGFAEYAVGYARHVVRVPDGVDPADAAPLTCAGVTTYKAVKVSGARLLGPRRRVRRRRPRPPRGPVRPHHRRLRGRRRRQPGAAREPPARSAPSTSSTPREEDPVAAIQRLGGADAAISTAVTPERVRAGVPLARAAAARLVCVGLPADNHMRDPDLRDRARRADDQRARSSARATTSRRSSSCTAAGSPR